MKNPNFKIVNNKLQLQDGDKEIITYNRLSFCIDISTPAYPIILKYGEQTTIEKWHSSTVTALTKAGPIGINLAKHYVVITQENWNLEDINKFVNTTGYIGKWILLNMPNLFKFETDSSKQTSYQIISKLML